MGIVGVIELAVGAAILAGWTRAGAYVASGWLLGVAANLVAAGFYDVAGFLARSDRLAAMLRAGEIIVGVNAAPDAFGR